ncbi:MAG: N-acetyl-alpha-D-glucosaminyl L-malate synthase BshA [Vicinamibacterales bacterium]
MNVGIVCYASVGGSGVVAAELSICLAGRGHEVHVVSSDPPFRLREYQPGVWFHRVETPGYPVFREPQYLLALANRLVEVCRTHSLDVIHAHYAIPHAAAAYLARQILASAGHHRVPKTVTTLHGTDVTILGSDPSYRETVAFCIDQSDRVTAVSASLRDSTRREMPVRREIVVIPNFLDCRFHGRKANPDLRRRLCPPDRYDFLLIHVSNFRPVKQVPSVVRIFDRVRRHLRSRLLLVGEGPEFANVERIVRELGLGEDVQMLGEESDVSGLLSVADLFLLPSLQESFGLAALEAMSCGVPVVASNVGGLPEVVSEGVTGFLHPPERLDEMAASAISVLSDSGLAQRMSESCRRLAIERFNANLIVPRYEDVYRQVLAG